MPADSAVDDALDATLTALDLTGPHPPKVRLKLVRSDGEGPSQLHPVEETGLTHGTQPSADGAGAEAHVAGDAPLGHSGETRIALVSHQLPARLRLLLDRERHFAARAATLRRALDWTLELHAASLDNAGGEL